MWERMLTARPEPDMAQGRQAILRVGSGMGI